MQTVFFDNRPGILSTGTIVGNMEKSGPLGKHFPVWFEDDKFGEKTFELCERKMLHTAITQALEHADLEAEDIDIVLSGDLMNQLISSNYAVRGLDTAFAGMYGACSTMAETLLFGGVLVNAKHFRNVICCTASHFGSVERLFRFPLELGTQRTPTCQWTVTGSGAFVLSDSVRAKKGEKRPVLTCGTFGKVVDYGVTDANNMGAAMAPAARDTILVHLKERGVSADYYDMILTGDLGYLGSSILNDLMREKDCDIDPIHNDCGMLIYEQLHDCRGGSGAGCSASVLSSYIYKKMKKGKLNRVLFVATGALLSTVSVQQKDSIPCIAHAVAIENL